MKRLMLGWLLLVAGVAGLTPCRAENPQGTITMSGAWALYPLAVKWGEEFHNKYPGVRLDISAGGAGKGVADALAGAVDIGMVSRDISPDEVAKGALGIAVAKDAVVPMVNARNPVLARLQAQGMRREAFEGLWIRQEAATWGALAGGSEKMPVRVYNRSDACGAAETWAKYFGKKQEDLKGVGVYGDPGIAEAVRKDPLGIGYNNVSFAYDAKTSKPVAGLAVAPIDVNGNGTLDREEAVYATREDLLKAIADGRYPSPPARELYLLTKGKPAREIVRLFIGWVLTDGQAFVAETGYINLSPGRLAEEQARLQPAGP